jgi:Zn-dependent peptidase ImmA (M78 family)
MTRTSAVLAARQLLADCGVTEPPVPLDQLVEYCGAELVREPLEGDISGMVFRDESRKVIGVNSLEVGTRQRFTIAHEIGHLLLHEGRPVIVEKLVRVNLRGKNPSGASAREEREANQFAAELLMPEHMVRKAAHEVVGDRTLVSDRRFVSTLAKRFEVSGQAMEYRLVNLGLLSALALEGG